MAAFGGCADTNHPPALAFVEDQVVFVGQGLQVILGGSDPDGDPLTFEVEGLPHPPEVVAQTAQVALLVWNPSIVDTAPEGRVYTVKVRASDGRGGVASMQFRVTVLPAYGVPVFDLPDGVVLNLAEDKDLTLLVQVKDDDSIETLIAMSDGPAGAKLSKSGAKSAYLFWKPTDQQRLDKVHRVVLSATDETHPPVIHVLLIVLVNAYDNASCEGTPPSLDHVALADQNLGGGALTFQVDAHDTESSVTSVTLLWTLGDPDTGGFKQESLSRLDTNPKSWIGALHPGAPPPAGTLLHYHLVATDNDDPVGTGCDRTARLPKEGNFAVGLYPAGTSNLVCVDDGAEDDDTVWTAGWLDEGFHPGRRLCHEDVDVARVALEAGETCTVRVHHGVESGAVQLRLLDTGGAAEDQATSLGGSAQVVTTVGAATDRYVEVRALSPTARLSYSLEIGLGYADCDPDLFEPNDTAGQASFDPGDQDHLTLCPGDEDWFRVDLGTGDLLEISLALDSQLGDLDLQLLNGDGSDVLASSSSTGDAESVAHVAPFGGPVLFRVFGYAGATNVYDLRVERSLGGSFCFEDLMGVHDTVDGALGIFAGLYENMVACPGVPDWFLLDLNGGEVLELTVKPDGPGPTPSLELFDGSGTTSLATGLPDGDGGVSLVRTAAVIKSFTYRIQSTSSAAYSLMQQVTDPPGPCQPDRYEPNDTVAMATAVDPGVMTWLRLCGGTDQDMFQVQAQAFETIEVTTAHASGGGYSDLKVLAPDGVTPLAESLDYGSGTSATALAEQAGVYTVVVIPFGLVDSLPYDLAIVLY